MLGPEYSTPHLKHGTVMWQVNGGEGQFAGARGRITSNFFVSDTGDVTDNHFGVIFVNQPNRALQTSPSAMTGGERT